MTNFWTKSSIYTSVPENWDGGSLKDGMVFYSSRYSQALDKCRAIERAAPFVRPVVGKTVVCFPSYLRPLRPAGLLWELAEGRAADPQVSVE